MAANGNSGGGGKRGPARGAGFLKAFDLYRHVPVEMTEGSLLGSSVSLAAVAIMILLFTWQLITFLKVTVVTKIEVDHSEDGTFDVNFALVFPMVSCEFLSVDAVDIIGHRKANLSLGEETIHRYTLDGTIVGAATKRKAGPELYGGKHDPAKAVATAAVAAAAAAVGDSAGVTPEGAGSHATLVEGPKAFDQYKASQRVLLVNFFAPWCPHCVRFAPIWSAAAKSVASTLAAQGRASSDLLLASVDCTRPVNEPICSGQEIMAFPSVRVYREGSDAHHGPAERHEAYHGTRDAAAIAAFAQQVLVEVAGQKALPESGVGTDADGDAKPESMVLTKGCMVDGHVRVARVPGSITFSPHSEGHSFDAAKVNMTHVVKHLSFGRHRDRAPRRYGRTAPRQTHVGSMVLPINMGGAFAVPVLTFPEAPNPHGTRARFESTAHAGGIGTDWARSPAHAIFRSEEDAIVHEHYAKVVPVRYVPLRGSAVRLYEYTIASNAYQVPAPGAGGIHPTVGAAPVAGTPTVEAATKELMPPEVRFTYDLSPMRVAYLETKQGWLAWLTSLCALIGGVYTCASLLEGALQNTLRLAKKQQMGKLG